MKAAVARLRELGRAEVAESSLFAMVAQMREITDAAAAATRKARREQQRRTEAPFRPRLAALPPELRLSQAGTDDEAAARPFEVIEQW